MISDDLPLEFVRVVERAAIAAARTMGQGDRKYADQVAVEAMRKEMESVDIAGTIVIGEGERDEAPMLFIGEKVGKVGGTPVDIAVDPLEGTNLCATGAPNAIAVLAASDCVQIHGGNGFSDEYPAGRFFRNSKAAVIYEGTREIHKIMQADYALGFRQDKPRRVELPAHQK